MMLAYHEQIPDNSLYTIQTPDGILYLPDIYYLKYDGWIKVYKKWQKYLRALRHSSSPYFSCSSDLESIFKMLNYRNKLSLEFLTFNKITCFMKKTIKRPFAKCKLRSQKCQFFTFQNRLAQVRISSGQK